MKRAATLSISVCLCAALSVPALAQSSGGQNDQPQQLQQQKQAQQQQRAQSGQKETCKGKVMDVRTVNLKGERDKHVLAKVQDEQGRTFILDCGAAENLRQQEAMLQKGQQISAEGVAGRVNDMPILVVTRFTSQGQSRTISPQSRAQTSGRQPGQSDARQGEFRGRVNDYRNVRVGNSTEPHVFATIELENGRTMIADLGPLSEIRKQKVQLQRGQNVKARGAVSRFNNQPVLIVYSFTPQGQRTAMTPVGQQAQQRSADRRMAAASSDTPWSQRQMVTGRIVEMADVDVEGIDEKNRLIKIRTNNNRIAVIDLGPSSNQLGLSLENGDTVLATGEATRVNNLPLFRAEQIAEIAEIEREDQEHVANR